MTAEIKQALKSMPLLTSLSEPLLEQLSTFSKLRRVRAGETIFCQGEPSPYCFGIVHGQVSIQRVFKDKQLPPKVLSLLGPGAFFGESALFEDRPRAAMASAVQEGQLIAIYGANWRDWIKKDTQASAPLLMGLLQNTMGRLQQTSSDLAVIYSIGRLLAGPSPFNERLAAAISFVRSSLPDVDHVVFYERSLYWNEFQMLTLSPESESLPPISINAPWVTRLSAGAPCLVGDELQLPWRAASNAVVPLINLSEPSEPTCAVLILSSEESSTAFNSNALLLLSALGNQFAEAFIRHRRQEELVALNRLQNSRKSIQL
jgi:CRP/FNR family transcriptional regulator, cyclic AMP receptor protein